MMEKSRSTSKSVMRLLKGGVFFLVLIGGVFVALQILAPSDKSAAPKAFERALPVRVIVAKQDEQYSFLRSFVGQISAARSSQIGFERSGRLIQVLVDDGAKVRKNAILARLDTEKLKNVERQLRAQLAEIKARLTSARLRETRRKELLSRGHSSKEAFDNAKYSVGALVAQADRITAQIEAISIDIRKSVLRAPYDAIVASRKADEGTVVRAGQSIIVLQEASKLEARIGIPHSLANAVPVGSKHVIHIGKNKRRGKVIGVTPAMNMSTRTVTVILELGKGVAAPVGEIVRLRISRTVMKKGFWLPLTALTEGLRGLWKVYVVKSDDKTKNIARLVRKDVEIIHISTGRVFVTGTLVPGDRVVSTGLHKLAPGQRVEVLPVSAAIKAVR